MSAEFIAEAGMLKGVILSLEAGEEWTIGRDPDQVTLVLEDATVDRRHLLCRRTPEGYLIENLSSNYPVLLNGAPLLTPTLLHADDRITLGSTTFRFQPEETASTFEVIPEYAFTSEGNFLDPELQQQLLAASSKLNDLNQSDQEPRPQEPQELPAPPIPVLPEIAETTSPPKKRKPRTRKKAEETAPEEKAPTTPKRNNKHDTLPGESDAPIEEPAENKPEEVPSLPEAFLEPEALLPPPQEAAASEPEQTTDEKVSQWVTKAEPEYVPLDDTGPIDEEAELIEAVEEAPTEPEPMEEEAPALFPESEDAYELPPYEEIFQERDHPEPLVDLTLSSRFIIKIIAGPNTGAEFLLDLDRTYVIGTDTASCDIIFNDLSVSRVHARLAISATGDILIEDLKSRNGVIVDKKRIVGATPLLPNSVVGLGTSAFLLIDREAPSETIVAPLFDKPEKEEVEEPLLVVPQVVAPAAEAVLPPPKVVPMLPMGTLILFTIIAGLVLLLGIGTISLFQSREVELDKKDLISEVQSLIKPFPAVRFTYNAATGQLFLMGHVSTGIELNELIYQLKSLAFVKGIENNIVNDEAIWQEINILLSKIPEFKGVSMHAPQAGEFVISGYLKTDQQAANLIDYLNINFNYLNLLKNRVVVEQQVVEEVTTLLIQHQCASVTASFSSGELLLTGYIGATQSYDYANLLAVFQQIPGVRSVKNFVVVVSPEQGVIDLNKRYPGKYRITGFSKYGDVNINVVINGRIVSRGDQIEGMTITSIQQQTVFLEKDGLKYKIDYNK